MISVCMATYNGERFIKEQIDSILPQLSENDELIISDDGSTDRTLEIIASYEDRRIKVLHHKKNPKLAKVKHGRNFYYVTENFENALKEASGDYIFLSDQDDVWCKDKVKKCVNEMQSSLFVVHNMKIIDENGNMVKNPRYNDNPLPKNWLAIVYHMRLWGCCMAFRKECLAFILPFPDRLLAHDYWLAALCIKKVRCSYIELPLINYREHSDSVSYKRHRSIFYKISYRFKLLFEIVGRK